MMQRPMMAMGGGMMLVQKGKSVKWQKVVKLGRKNLLRCTRRDNVPQQILQGLTRLIKKKD